jgi:AraC-like DNA-binding protein
MLTKTPNVEEEFMSTLHQTIEKHLSDSSFTVARLTRLVGMSRTALHRKLIQRTGLSASAYVRHIRVKYAKDLLLRHPDWCVCHVAYEAGFNTPSYFTRVFKSIHGTGPEAFRQNIRQDS